MEIESLDSYLYSSVRYGVLKQVASHKITVDFFDALENLPLQASSADTNIVSKELWAAYNDMVGTMPAQRQKIFRMRFEDNMKTKAIAEELNITQKTVQNQLITSSQQIRSLLTIWMIFACLLFGRI